MIGLTESIPRVTLPGRPGRGPDPESSGPPIPPLPAGLPRRDPGPVPRRPRPSPHGVRPCLAARLFSVTQRAWRQRSPATRPCRSRHVCPSCGALSLGGPHASFRPAARDCRFCLASPVPVRARGLVDSVARGEEHVGVFSAPSRRRASRLPGLKVAGPIVCQPCLYCCRLARIAGKDEEKRTRGPQRHSV